MLVKVFTDTGKKCTILNAKVIRTENDRYFVKYLSPTNSLFKGRKIYKYEDEVYEVEDESITEFIEEDESVLGFEKHNDVFLKYESDSDYESSTSSNETEEFSYESSQSQ